MLSLNDANQKYVVSLDRLDINFLSQYVKKYADENKILWSKSFMNVKSMYCEVEISSDDFEDEDAYIEPAETYLCHICNIHVALSYYKQHNKSRRHQIYKKLAEKAVANLLKQINIDIDFEYDLERHDKLYCDICSKVILVKHKRQHNKSKLHLHNLENLKLADMFVEAYVKIAEGPSANSESIACDDGSETDWNFETDSEYESVANYNNSSPETSAKPSYAVATTSKLLETNKECTIDSANYNKSSPQTSAKTSYAVATTSKSLERNKECTVVSANYTKSPPETSAKPGYAVATTSKPLETNEECTADFCIPAADGDCIIIVTPRGYKEKVSIDFFHSYTRTNNSIFCQLCGTSVEDTSQHSRTKEHVTHIIQPIDDYFSRGMSLKDGWGHCVLCNELMFRSIHPFITPKHSKYNKMYTPKDKTKSKKTLCVVCKVFIDTHNFSAHVNSKKHTSKLNLINESFRLALTATDVPPLEIKNEFCKICQVIVPLGGMAVHEAGKAHQDKCLTEIEVVINYMTTEPDNVTTSDNQLVLNSDLPNTSKSEPVLQPTSGVKELSKEEKLTQYNKQMAILDANTVQCLICDLKVPNNNIIEHVEDAQHKTALELILSMNKVILGAHESYYCKLCTIYIDDVIQHIKKDLHHITKDILQGTVNKAELRKYVYENTLDNNTLAVAYRCIYRDMLHKNRIVRVNDLMFYCKVCSKNLPQITEIEHIFERHKSSFYNL